jgi:hypothetical protein
MEAESCPVVHIHKVTESGMISKYVKKSTSKVLRSFIGNIADRK